jgi:predicted permease
VGVLWAAGFSHGQTSLKNILLRLVRFPPFIAFVAAFFIPADSLDPIHGLLKTTGSLMVPMAIFSVGMQFRFDIKGVDAKAFFSGLFFKLIFVPAILYTAVFIVLQKSGPIFEVAFIECAMPPMITASIIANQYDLEGDLANALVTYGIPVSFATLWLWSFAL